MSTTAQTKLAIIELLNAHGNHSWQNQTVGIKGRRLPKDSLGVADIICVLKPFGQHMEVDVKTNLDRPSERQLEHKNKIEARGAIYIFAKSLDDFIEQMKSLK